MLVFDQVPDESLACFCIELVGGIANTGTIGNEFLSVVDTLVGKLLGGLTVGYQGYIHLQAVE